MLVSLCLLLSHFFSLYLPTHEHFEYDKGETYVLNSLASILLAWASNNFNLAKQYNKSWVLKDKF